MSFEFNTLGDLLSNPKIRPVAQDAIRRRNLKEEELWNMTLSQLKEEHFFSGEINDGIRRLYEAADTGDWYYPLYSEKECDEDEARRGVSLVWFPSADPEADNRPFMLVVPGGGFVNVWNLTEGWPIAEQYNRCGYHAFILTYQVGEEAGNGLLQKNMEDFATYILGEENLAEKMMIAYYLSRKAGIYFDKSFFFSLTNTFSSLISF